MISPVDSLILNYLMDAERILRRRLQAIPELAALEDDAEVSGELLDEAVEIARWLSPDDEPTVEQQIEAITGHPALTPKQKIEAIQKAFASPKGKRGRRRASDALWLGNKALLLRYGFDMSWRAIAMELGGCCHYKNERPALSCRSCGDRVRKNAERLQSVLNLAGYEVEKLGELQGLPHTEQMIRQYIALLPGSRSKKADRNG